MLGGISGVAWGEGHDAGEREKMGKLKKKNFQRIS